MTLNDLKVFGKALAIRVFAFFCVGYLFYRFNSSLGVMLLGAAGILVVLMLYRTSKD